MIGGIQTAVFNLSITLAQLNTSTSRAAVMTFTMPMMAAILSWLVIGELIEGRKIVALALGMVGVFILAWQVFVSLSQVHDARQVKALIFPLVAAFGWAARIVGQVCRHVHDCLDHRPEHIARLCVVLIGRQ